MTDVEGEPTLAAGALSQSAGRPAAPRAQVANRRTEGGGRPWRRHRSPRTARRRAPSRAPARAHTHYLRVLRRA